MFLGEPLRVFHFFTFLFLHAFISSDVLRCFHCWLHLFTSLHCLLGTSFLYCTASASGLREHFFTLRRFLPYTTSRHLTQPAFINASLGPTVQFWRLRYLPLRLEKQTLPICLFKLHSVQEKVLVGRFYLCINASYGTLCKPLTGFEATI